MEQAVGVLISCVMAVGLWAFASGRLLIPRWQREERQLAADRARRAEPRNAVSYQVHVLETMFPTVESRLADLRPNRRDSAA